MKVSFEFLVGCVVGVSCDLIHVSGCNFGLNLSYIEAINDSKHLGKEPLKFRGFRVEKRRRKVVKHLGIGKLRVKSREVHRVFQKSFTNVLTLF